MIQFLNGLEAIFENQTKMSVFGMICNMLYSPTLQNPDIKMPSIQLFGIRFLTVLQGQLLQVVVRYASRLGNTNSKLAVVLKVP